MKRYQLSAIFPDLLSEYSSKNTKDFDEFLKTSKEKVLWECSKCGNEWSAQIRKRTYEKSGCPICARKRGKTPISIEFPNLVLDYDLSKNSKDIDEYTKGTYTKVHWKCHDCGNEWFASFNQRASKGHGCKICTTNREMERRNQAKISQQGSFADNHPDMAKEWDFELNKNKPEDYLSNSGQVVHWKCINGHSWQSSINDRTKTGTRCAKCFQHFSQNEIRLVSEFETIGFKVDWNKLHLGKEIDVFLPELSIGIEVDGYPWHDSEVSRVRDKEKNHFFEIKGIRIIRLRDERMQPLTKHEVTYKHEEDLFPSFKTLIEILISSVGNAEIQKRLEHYLKTQTSFLGEDKFQNMMRKVGILINRPSLKDKFPLVAKEFSNKNLPLVAENVTAHSKRNVWWVCSVCSHEWHTQVNQRTRTDGKGSGCPNCNSTSVVNEQNNLIAKVGHTIKIHWDYELNDKNPEDYRPYSKDFVWWKCPSGHSFKQSVSVLGDKRSKNIKCTICSMVFEK